MNGAQIYRLLFSGYSEPNGVFVPAPMYWVTPMNAGDYITVQVYVFGTNGISAIVSDSTSYFIGSKIG